VKRGCRREEGQGRGAQRRAERTARSAGARTRGSTPSGGWDRRQAGFTLVEIMIALIVSSLLVAMILSIFTQMSAAYRTQQQVAELQQVLQASEATIEADLRQAGFRCAQGFTWAGSPASPISALTITDGGTGPQQPDQIAIFYGDPSAQAQVTAVPASGQPLTTVTVDAVDASWAIGDKVLFSVADPGVLGRLTFEATPPPEEPPTSDPNSGTATIPYYYACVLQISNINGTTISFSTVAPWGSASNAQCDVARRKIALPDKPAMLYKFVARAYRIDPTRKDLSVFQQSPSGALVANDWTDLGIGFTNFQIASRWYSAATGAGDNSDGDADAFRNWYSSTNQNFLSTADVLSGVTPADYSKSLGGATNSLEVPLQVSVSFVVRTTRHVVDGTVTGATPELQVAGNVDANDLGNSPKVQLAGVADASRPQELRGDNIYRYATIKVDTRNLGVNR